MGGRGRGEKLGAWKRRAFYLGEYRNEIEKKNARRDNKEITRIERRGKKRIQRNSLPGGPDGVV